MKLTKRFFAIFCCVLVIFLVGCNNDKGKTDVGDNSGEISADAGNNNGEVKTQELSKKFTAQNVEALDCDDTFANAYNEISANLVKTAYKGDNTLISPLSIELAFSMLTNGAVDKSQVELETFLGGLDIETLNKYNKKYVEGVVADKDLSFNVANSIWLKNDKNLSVKDAFLQTNANYYSAQVYSSNFDDATKNDINDWVSKNTNGMIKQVIDKIDESTIFYLINALCMEAEWQAKFIENEVIEQDFTNLDGSKSKVEMMQDSEYNYIEGEKATGFMKRYKGGRYAFCGLLPNEGVDFAEFVNSLSGETLTKYLTTTSEEVIIKMPKMKVEYEVNLIDVLKKLGVTEIFNSTLANLTNLATYKDANIFISMAKHKTFMEVDTNGTKAAAVTIIGGDTAAAPSEHQPKRVTLDRPFVYGIIDTQTKMPIFIGTQTKF